jgi:hypothetical protein
MVVIELAANPLDELIAPRHGTEWQPFLWSPSEPEGASAAT